MHDPRIDRLAKVLVNYSVAVKKDDVVLITGTTSTEAAVLAAYREVLKAGGYPWVRLVPEGCSEILLRHATDGQLTRTPPFDKHIMSKANARIAFWGCENTRALSQTNSAKQALLSKGRRPIMNELIRRASLPARDPNRLRWSGTSIPTHGLAQEAEMSLSDYADFVFNAGRLNEANPVAAWKKLSVAQQRLIDVLKRGREMRIRVPGGTDVRFGIAKRRWINCDGHENFPDGEVFTGPIEDSAEGTVCFEYPTLEGGREVDGIRLTLRSGKVVDATARKNQKHLLEMLEQDRGARYVGELALGTNYAIKQYTRNTLFDEKIGGTFHLALGAAYPETGSKNTSGLHWDLVCNLRRGGMVEVDGKIISKNGKFAKATWPH